jgi:hypothetical protein
VPADRGDVRRRIGKVISEGAVHLDVDKTWQDARPWPTQRPHRPYLGRLDGDDAAAIDRDDTKPPVVRTVEMAEQLDHSADVTFEKSRVASAIAGPSPNSEWTSSKPLRGAWSDHDSDVTRV